MARDSRPTMPGFTGRFSHLMSNVKWVDRGSPVIRTFGTVTLAHEITRNGFPVSATYVSDLAAGRKANPSALFVWVAGDVFGDFAQMTIGPRYFFDDKFAERVNEKLRERSREVSWEAVNGTRAAASRLRR